MLKIEKTLQSVRDLLDRLSKEGVEFALVESEYSDYVADIRTLTRCTCSLTARFVRTAPSSGGITTIIKESATSTNSACG